MIRVDQPHGIRRRLVLQRADCIQDDALAQHCGHRHGQRGRTSTVQALLQQQPAPGFLRQVQSRKCCIRQAQPHITRSGRAVEVGGDQKARSRAGVGPQLGEEPMPGCRHIIDPAIRGIVHVGMIEEDRLAQCKGRFSLQP